MSLHSLVACIGGEGCSTWFFCLKEDSQGKGFTGCFKEFDSRPGLVSFSVFLKTQITLLTVGNDEGHSLSSNLMGENCRWLSQRADQDILCFSVRIQKVGRGN